MGFPRIMGRGVMREFGEIYAFITTAFVLWFTVYVNRKRSIVYEFNKN